MRPRLLGAAEIRSGLILGRSPGDVVYTGEMPWIETNPTERRLSILIARSLTLEVRDGWRERRVPGRFSLASRCGLKPMAPLVAVW